MAGLGRSERLLSRLEDRMSTLATARDSMVLAFSGGVGSLVLGSVARKRTDLRCVVAGVDDARDRAAAALAEKYLDFRMRPLPLTANRALPLAQRLSASHPGLQVAEILALLPLRAVVEAHPGTELLAGFWASRLAAHSRRVLRGWNVRAPLTELAVRRSPDRADLVRMGRHLGIPDVFLQVRSRSPATGSGVGRALHAFAHQRGTTIARLIRP